MIERKYWSNGQPWCEKPYHKGKLHGIVKYWHENGQLWHEIPYHKERRHGIEKRWNEDGKLYYKIYCLIGSNCSTKRVNVI